MTELRSDLDAVVQSLEKVSVGAVLQSGEHFITLVPSSAKLEIEANIAGRDSGHVHVRDPVIIKFDTFPFSQFGVAEGVVEVVSPQFMAQTEARNPTGTAPPPGSASDPFSVPASLSSALVFTMFRQFPYHTRHARHRRHQGGQADGPPISFWFRAAYPPEGMREP